MIFTIVDYIVLGVLLLFLIIGLAKGFFKMVFSLSKKIISLVLAYFLVSPVRSFVISSELGLKINNYCLDIVNSKLGDLALITNPSAEQIESLSDLLNLPKFVINLLYKAFQNDVTTMPLGESIAQTISYYFITIVSFIVLVIVIALLVFILARLLNSLFETPVLKPINRLLGMGLGLIIGVMIISFIFLIAQSMVSLDFVGDLIEKYIDPNNPEFGIARFLYNNNFLLYALENIIHINDIF